MTPRDAWDDEVREAYQRPLAGETEARERAIARLRGEDARRAARSAEWWLDPNALTMRPLVAAACMLVALAIGAFGGARWMASRRPVTAPPAPIAVEGGDRTTVTFVFRAPGATRVCVAGDFNGWDPDATPLTRVATGDTWTARVPLENGLHTYAFVIDGREWTPDPSAPLAPVAAFGRRNSVLVVGEDHVL